MSEIDKEILEGLKYDEESYTVQALLAPFWLLAEWVIDQLPESEARTEALALILDASNAAGVAYSLQFSGVDSQFGLDFDEDGPSGFNVDFGQFGQEGE